MACRCRLVHAPESPPRSITTFCPGSTLAKDFSSAGTHLCSCESRLFEQRLRLTQRLNGLRSLQSGIRARNFVQTHTADQVFKQHRHWHGRQIRSSKTRQWPVEVTIRLGKQRGPARQADTVRWRAAHQSTSLARIFHRRTSVGGGRPPLGCATAPRFGTGHRPLGQPAGHVFVKHARDERLVRHALLQGFDLNVAQVAGRQTDVDPPVLGGRSACCRLEFFASSLL